MPVEEGSLEQPDPSSPSIILNGDGPQSLRNNAAQDGHCQIAEASPADLESAESRVGIPPAVSRIGTFPFPLISAEHLFTVSYLVFFSIFGTLARLGLKALTVYPGAPVITGVLWENVGGSLVMGYLAHDRKLFRQLETQPEERMLKDKSQRSANKKTIPLYIGLTTGFCGSVTSFSAFMVDAFLALSNDLSSPNAASPSARHAGYSFMAVVAVIVSTTALSLCALVFGAHLADALNVYTPALSPLLSRRFIDPAFIFLGLGCWLGSILLAVWTPDPSWRGHTLCAIVFAPLGTLLRFYISLPLNSGRPTFPLGTFVANILGTIVLGMCFDLQHARRLVGVDRVVGCQVLNGVMDGFCGCLTTVSTWAAEIHSLKRRDAYRYGVISIGLGLVMLVVIIGSMRWSVGMDTPVC